MKRKFSEIDLSMRPCLHVVRKYYVLPNLEGLQQQKVADYLGISVRTVESQIRIAYQSIREGSDKDDPMILFFLIGAYKQMEKEDRKSKRSREYFIKCIALGLNKINFYTN